MSWNLEQTEFCNCAKLRDTEVWLDREKPDFLEVMAEQGSGYQRESITTNIPIEVLVKLLEHAGYKVTK